MARRCCAAWLLVLLVPLLAAARPVVPDSRPHPGTLAAVPSYVQRVEPAVVAVHVRADPARPSSQRLGARRFGSGIVVDPRGYVLTVSYVLVDAQEIEVRLRDGRIVAARLAGLDLDSGLGVVELAGGGPWPSATLGSSADARPGALTATVGVDEVSNALVHVTGALRRVQRFSAYWEYMLERALFVAPGSPSWGGSAVVDEAGRVIGIASLRLGDPPHVNLAIPVELFLAVKDEVIAAGRVVSRPPRPWLGIYTIGGAEAVVVDGFSESGPARTAGFRRGDRIVRVDGAEVRSQEQFYAALWRRRAGDLIEVGVVRDGAMHTIGVRSIDRHRLLRSLPR
jgi:S1-C subfamily serine protease